MATTNEILAEIAAYTAANGRPCPAKHLTDKFGADADALIQSLKASGTIIGKRGRTGGLVAADAANTAVPSAVQEVHATPADALAAEFAALAEKLAQEENAAAVANG
jgi:hypothetical protein